ncbi:MAG: hypothetical protein DMG22_00440 [Acidobacteria bacterium]|nr:MAG: hypothetical protein DMG22_00440 [Acidobacteriota bacterium]
MRDYRLDDAEVRGYQWDLPAVVVVLDQSLLLRSAQGQLLRGVRRMLGRTLRVQLNVPCEGAIVLGTLDELRGRRRPHACGVCVSPRDLLNRKD